MYIWLSPKWTIKLLLFAVLNLVAVRSDSCVCDAFSFLRETSRCTYIKMYRKYGDGNTHPAHTIEKPLNHMFRNGANIG
jgi:hypothetical protein